EAAVAAVEGSLVRGSAADVVGVGGVAVEDEVLIRAQPVKDRALEQIGGAVVLVHEPVTELPGNAEDAEAAHRVDEERVGAVEGVDVPKGIGVGGFFRWL